MCVYRGDGGYALGHLSGEAVTINRAAHQKSQNTISIQGLGRCVAASPGRCLRRCLRRSLPESPGQPVKL